MNLRPIIKWTGGKRREIKYFEKYIPDHSQYVEPFIGGGALYFHLNNLDVTNIINDYDEDLINLYNAIVHDYNELNQLISDAKKLNGNYAAMAKEYYRQRDMPENKKQLLTQAQKAFNFLYVNQLAFAGMRRFNSLGKFNIPFGHYKSFNFQITEDHFRLLKSTKIENRDALSVIPEYDQKDTFFFIDPPYTRIFKEYSPNNVFDDNSQIQLRNTLASLKNSKWMVVIDASDTILNLYKDFFQVKYILKYGVNIKNRFSTDVEHVIITNYSLSISTLTDFIIF